MNDTAILNTLESIDTKMTAMLAIQTHRALVEDENLASPRPRSIDKLLHDAGLTQTEVAKLLGKTSQAVGQMIAKG